MESTKLSDLPTAGQNEALDVSPNDECPFVPASAPSVLVKAANDCWSYAVQLRTGIVVTFSECTFINAEWVCLNGVTILDSPLGDDFSLGRGLEVRLTDVVWVLDNNS